MITLDIFLVGLMVVSTLTSLVTEAVKTIMTEHNTKYHASTLSGVIAAVLSAAIGAGYLVLSNSGFTAQNIVCIIAMMFMSWLCAMVGYDKVIKQLKTTKKDDE
jgi:drug/metabolite transporter (DMT)-like permease